MFNLQNISLKLNTFEKKKKRQRMILDPGMYLHIQTTYTRETYLLIHQHTKLFVIGF